MDASATLNGHRQNMQRERERLRAELSGEPDPVRRSAEEKGISLRELARSSQTRATASRRRTTNCAIGGSTGSWALIARRCPRRITHSTSTASPRSRTCTRRSGPPRSAWRRCGPRSRPRVRPEHPRRPRGSSPEGATSGVDSRRPTLGRVPDHAGTGRSAGLPELSARSRARSPLLGLRPFAPVRLPQALTRQRPDRDLLLHRSGRHPRACMACATFRSIRRPGSRERRGGSLPGSAHVPAERCEASFRARFWGRFSQDGGTPDGYAERLTAATGFAHRSDRYLADMDADFYSADYLRAALRSAQLRAHLRAELDEDWWCSPNTGSFLRELFREGTRPSNEEIAGRLGFEPFDTEPLVAELTTSR